VVLDDRTCFEGVVRGPDGKPAAGAVVRADLGPRMPNPGYIIGEIWTETKADAAGKYRLLVHPDSYKEVQVKAAGVGVARLPGRGVVPGEAKKLDVRLDKAVTFRAVAVDAETGKPVRGVRLWHFQHPGVEGRSDDKGEITIPDMLPGPFAFWVEVTGYARWW